MTTDNGAPRRMGRPTTGSARKVSTSITLDAEVLALMREEAARRRLSLSALIETTFRPAPDAPTA